MKGMLKSINQTKYTVFEHVCKINVTLLLGLQWPLSRAGSLLPDDECLCPVHIHGCCLGKLIFPLSQKRVNQPVFSSRNLQKSICDSVFQRLSRLHRLVFALGLRDGFGTAGKICICTVGYLGRKSIQVLQWPCWLAWRHPAKMRTDDHAGDLQKMKSKSTNVSTFNMLNEMSDWKQWSGYIGSWTSDEKIEGGKQNGKEMNVLWSINKLIISSMQLWGRMAVGSLGSDVWALRGAARGSGVRCVRLRVPAAQLHHCSPRVWSGGRGSGRSAPEPSSSTLSLWGSCSWALFLDRARPRAQGRRASLWEMCHGGAVIKIVIALM